MPLPVDISRAIHQEALAAIHEGREAAVRRLIQGPFESRHMGAVQWLSVLASAAVEHGQLGVVKHLANQLSRPAHRADLLSDVWFAAIEHHQPKVVKWARDQLLAQHSRTVFGLYQAAAQRRSLPACCHLLDHERLPKDLRSEGMKAMWHILERHTDTLAEAGIALVTQALDRLLQLGEPDPHHTAGRAAVVMVRMQRLDLAHRWVDRMDFEVLVQWVEPLRKAMMGQADVEGLVRLKTRGASQHTWSQEVVDALRARSTLGALAILDSRPEARLEFQQNVGLAGATLSSLLIRERLDTPEVKAVARHLMGNHPIDPLLRILEDRVGGSLPAHLREEFQARWTQAANRLFLLARFDDQTRLLAEQPILFASGESKRREQAAHNEGTDELPVRHRVRRRS